MGKEARKIRRKMEKLRLIKGGKKPGQVTRLGYCGEAREDYECLEGVECCGNCHNNGDLTKVQDAHGYFEVCCTVRQALCPSENKPTHPGAACSIREPENEGGAT